jgi:signal transduction histidine kinase
VTYLLAVSAIFLIVFGYYRSVEFPSIAFFTGVYAVLLFAEPFFFRHKRIRTYIYLIAQIAVICGLAPIIRNWDFWALLVCPLVVQAMVSFEPRTGYFLTGILIVVSACLLLVVYDSIRGGLPKIPVWGSAYLLMAALVAISREAVAARDQSRKQQAELELAHRQLQHYTERAEELAVLQERNRLARELHDAVTQTLFSASLIAEAMPALWERDQEMGQERLAMLRQMSRGALAEMRTLLLELRPAALVETSLGDLLRQLGEAVTGRAGIPVTVEVEGLCELPADLHVALYRIAQEALNNVVKHAKASQVAVSLRCTPRVPSGGPPSSRRQNGQQDAGSPPSSSRAGEEGPEIKVELVIRDNGRGFDLDDLPPEGMGLGIMRERAEAVGAQLGIVSQLSQGTRLTVIWPGDSHPRSRESCQSC